jgi:hypothetical protein
VAVVNVSTGTKKGQVGACLKERIVPEMHIILQEGEVDEIVLKTLLGLCDIQGRILIKAAIARIYFQEAELKEKRTGIIFWQNKMRIGPEKESEEIKYFNIKSFFNPDKPSGFFNFTHYYECFNFRFRGQRACICLENCPK